MTRARKHADAVIAYGAAFGMETMAASGVFLDAITCPKCGCRPCARVSPAGSDDRCRCVRSCYPVLHRGREMLAETFDPILRAVPKYSRDRRP